jgi:hypothetical protein
MVISIFVKTLRVKPLEYAPPRHDAPHMASRADVPPEILPFLDAAYRYVKRALDVELDGSEASLAYLDHYVTHTARKEASDARLGAEVMALLAPAIGAYFGEVAIARLGGRWIIDGADPAGWRVQLAPAPVTLFPVGMAAEALIGGPVEGYDGSFSTEAHLMAPLAEALERAPPVDEDYYYSLTGRLETLEQVVDLLVEIQRRRQEEAN